jgi:hypothetical protein
VTAAINSNLQNLRPITNFIQMAVDWGLNRKQEAVPIS